MVAAAKNGDDSAFTELAEKYKGLLEKYAQSLTEPFVDSLPFCDTDDLMQEALCGLMGAVRTYDGVSSKFSTYAASCVHNSVVSYLRKHNKPGYSYVKGGLDSLENVATDNIKDSAELQVIDIESTTILYNKIISVLSAFERKVFELYLAEIPYAVIAKKLNKNEKCVDNAIQRIKAKLKKLV